MRHSSHTLKPFSRIAVVGGTPFDSGKGAFYLQARGIPAEPVAISEKPSRQAELYKDPRLVAQKFEEKLGKDRFSEVIIYCNSLSFISDWHQLFPGHLYELTAYYRSILSGAKLDKLAIVVAEENTRENLMKLVQKAGICAPSDLHIFPRLPLIERLELIPEKEQFQLLEETLHEYKEQGFTEILLGCTHLDHPEFNKIRDLKIYQPGLIMLDEFISDCHRHS